MPRHPTHSKGSWIMDLSAQPPVTYKALTISTKIVCGGTQTFSWRDTWGQIRSGFELRVFHAKWLKYVLRRKKIQALPTYAVYHFPKSDKPDVAINETGAWPVSQPLSVQMAHRLFIRRPSLAQIEVRRKPCAMCQ